MGIKQDAIKEAYADRLEDKEDEFKGRVQQLVGDIEELSDALRRKKVELMKLEFEAPEKLADIL